MVKKLSVVGLVLTGMTAAVELHYAIDSVSLESETRGSGAATRVPFSGSCAECDKALETLIEKSPDAAMSKLKGNRQHHMTVLQRAAGAFLYLHPKIYGMGSSASRLEKVSQALGIHKKTAGRWFSLVNSASLVFMQQWVPAVKGMDWRTVSKHFQPAWAEQWDIQPEENVLSRLKPYEDRIRDTEETFISKHTPGTTTAGRKSMAKNNPNVFVTKTTSKRKQRKDSKRARKHKNQEAFVNEIVQYRWRSGNPIGRIELKNELLARDDCSEGTEFYSSYLDPGLNGSGYSNWMDRVLDRMGFSFCQNSVGQTVPPTWREGSKECTERINKRFRDENVDVVVNADQTFCRFHLEEEYVAAPKGIKRVGGMVCHTHLVAPCHY